MFLSSYQQWHLSVLCGKISFSINMVVMDNNFILTFSFLLRFNKKHCADFKGYFIV